MPWYPETSFGPRNHNPQAESQSIGADRVTRAIGYLDLEGAESNEMSRKRNYNRKSMALLHSVIPCPNIDEYELEYYRPGCYCIPQVMPQVASYSCAYLHDYAPQWTAACNTATYVVDMCGMVYYLSDFEHQMQFSNNMVNTEIAYHIPHYVEEQDYDVAIEDDEGEAVSPRKRERYEDENDETEQSLVENQYQHSYNKALDRKCMVESQDKADGTEQGYIVEEPNDSETKVEQNVEQNKK